MGEAKGESDGKGNEVGNPVPVGLSGKWAGKGFSGLEEKSEEGGTPLRGEFFLVGLSRATESGASTFCFFSFFLSFWNHFGEVTGIITSSVFSFSVDDVEGKKEEEKTEGALPCGSVS